MNFGLVVVSWVAWVCLHGAYPDIPKPNNFWMAIAAVVAVVSDSETKTKIANIIQEKSDKN